MKTPDSFADWPGLAYRIGSLLFYICLSVFTVVTMAGLAGFIWVRWLA